MKYCDRSGNVYSSDTKQDKLLRRMYSKRSTRAVTKLLARPKITKACRALMDSRPSRIMIKRFVRRNNIDMGDYERRRFRSYNDFFTRRIAPGKRVICRDPDALITPCDGKVTVYSIDDDCHFTIKDTPYSVESLLKDEALAKAYHGGVCVVIRLTVDNYHRYVYVDSGRKSGNIYIAGVFHTVNPVANDHVPVYKENSREYCVISTERFGDIIQMEVGAMMVGRIVNFHQERYVKRGQEKGFFSFGGSTVVLLLKSGMVRISEDIADNSRNGFETIVSMGEEIGKVLSHE